MGCLTECYLPLTVVFIGVSTFLYYYLYRNLDYWTKRNINGPKPIPIFGNSLSMFLKAKPYVEVDWYRNYGKIFGVFMGNKPALTIAEPELIKQVLVKDFSLFVNRRNNPSNHKITPKNMFSARGEDWKRIRAIASPTFTSGKMKRMYPLINKCCADFLEALDSYANDRKEIELKVMHGAYTMDVIARCAFAANTNTHKDPNNAFTQNANDIFTAPLWKILFFSVLPTFISSNESFRRMISSKNPVDFFIDFTRHMMQHRKNIKEKHNDFLQLLMDVERNDNEIRDKNDSNESHHVNEGSDELNAEQKAFSGVNEKKLTENEILAQCFLFFIAGYETTATTLSFCSYELSVYPEIQEKLYEEIKEVFDENGDINYDTLSTLPYLDSVLSETLRLHPPVFRLEREASEDVLLGNTGLKIEKGVIAEIPVYAIHMDPNNYENPEQFIPERFMPENRDNIKPYTYLPFGAGPRNCIGMRFALLEAKLALAKILRRFRLFKTPNTDIPLVYNKGRFLMQAKRLIVGIEKR